MNEEVTESKVINNEKGLMIECIGNKDINHSKYYYNSKNQLVKKLIIDKNITTTQLYFYDDNNNQINFQQLDENGFLYGNRIYKYNSKNQLIEENFQVQGRNISMDKYDYNYLGFLSHKEFITKDEKDNKTYKSSHEYYEYEYDNNNNWIKKKVIHNTNYNFYVNREIEYYN